jgi:hypothetical protein
MGNDRRLIREVIAAGDSVGEPGWELPLWRRYRTKIASPVADVKNIGDRYGGAITAALFLSEFVGETPWCHLDVAGTAYWEKAGDYWPKGATGSPARTIIRYVLDRAGEGKAGGRPKPTSAAKSAAVGRSRTGSKSSAKARATTKATTKTKAETSTNAVTARTSSRAGAR